MKRLFILFSAVFLLMGCHTTSPSKKTVSGPSVMLPPVHAINSTNTETIENKRPPAPVLKKGGVVAKTQFSGVLNKSYVRLMIVDQKNPQRRYQLQIGKDSQYKFPWQQKLISPGYFYIQLPEGEYKIKSVTIPVGSSKAVEETNISFRVSPDVINYLGTLKMNGVRQRIKLGGVPVIRPGFDFTVEIIDENKQVLADLNDNLPKGMDLKVDLMRVN